MTTFADLVSRVKQQLIGYTKDQATITYLTQPMSAIDTTFTVDTETISQVSNGLVEIDDELILVKKYDRSSGVVTVMAGTNGRGREGTAATSHDVNDIVTADPRFPVARIREAVNECILGTYPDLFVFDAFEFPKNAAVYEYPVPEEVDEVYRVTAQVVGPSKVWFPVQYFRFNNSTNTDPIGGSPTGKTLTVMDAVTPGRGIRVVYTRSPTALVLPTDDLTTTGYPDRYADMIVWGTCARLLPAYEAARLQQSAVEASERAPLVPTSAANQASQYYLTRYKQRLDEERERLFLLNPQHQSFIA